MCRLRTIWDSLSEAGIGARCYSRWLLDLWGSGYAGITHSYEDYLNDAAAGELPSVSFVDAPYSELAGEMNDHPFADIRNGDAFLSRTYHTLANGPCWPKSVLIITFDEWGGFSDHVPRPRVVAPNSIDQDLVDSRVLLGLRVPTVIASPFSAGLPLFPRVNSTIFDHTSVLKLIEWRWNLTPLTTRDTSAEIGNLASALDFTSPQTELPVLPVGVPVAKSQCND